jgi:hypothetical protein
MVPRKQRHLPGLRDGQGRISKDSAASLSLKSSGSRNLPKLCLNQISHRETALTKTAFSGSLIISLVCAPSEGLASGHFRPFPFERPVPKYR